MSEDGTAVPLDQVLAAVRDAVMVTEAAPLTEPGPRIVYTNAAFTAMTGWLPSDVVGQSPRMLQAGGIDRAELRRLSSALERAEPCRIEVLNRRKDSSTYFVEIDVTPLYDGSRLTHFVAVQRETTQRRVAEEALRARVVHDDSTGLLNRRGLQQALELALAPTDGERASWTLLLCDIRGLRRLNSSLGRACGDEAVREVGRRLRAVAGEAPAVARLESGEFGWLLEGDELTRLVSSAERIRRAMLRPVSIADRQIVVSVSSGLASATPASTPESLLAEADLALRRAKTTGPDRYEFYDAAMSRDVAARLDLEQGLRQALQRRELSLHYQPIVELSDARICGAEGLLRWHRDGRVHAGPASFIPVAEQSGLIGPIGTWALHEACLAATAWQGRLPGVGVSVNLSPRQLADPGLLPEVDRALDCGLDRSLVTLEVTENALVTDPAAAAETLQSLRRRGLRLALDDFGTGYSSLAYLTSLPVDQVKLDKVFVDGVVEDAGSRAVITAVLALAGDLGLTVVGEGIETEQQRVALLAMGCRLGQGYLFARPAPASDLACVHAPSGHHPM